MHSNQLFSQRKVRKDIKSETYALCSYYPAGINKVSQSE